MIPGKIFTGFAKFQGIVSVNDFRLPFGLHELLQAPLCFLRSFCSARIRLDPLGGQVLHHDCISMIVSRFTTFTENSVICCFESPNFLAGGMAAPVRFLRRNSGPSGSECVNVVLARYHFSPRLLRWFARRTRGCVPMSWNTFIHKILRTFFQPFWQITQRVSPYLLVVFIFFVFFFFRFFAGSCDGLPHTRTPTSC